MYRRNDFREWSAGFMNPAGSGFNPEDEYRNRYGALPEFHLLYHGAFL
jgi:hypothetical protein